MKTTPFDYSLTTDVKIAIMGNWGTKDIKEDIVISQNAAGAGGSNANINSTDITVGILCTIAILVLAFYLYRHCKKKFYKKVFNKIDERMDQKPNNTAAAVQIPTVSARCCHQTPVAI